MNRVFAYLLFMSCYMLHGADSLEWNFFDLEDGSKLRFEMTRRSIPGKIAGFDEDMAVLCLYRYPSGSSKALLWQQDYSGLGKNESLYGIGPTPAYIQGARRFGETFCVVYGDQDAKYWSYIRVDTKTNPPQSVLLHLDVGRLGREEGVNATILNAHEFYFNHGSSKGHYSISADGHVARDGVNINAHPVINGKRTVDDYDAARRVLDFNNGTNADRTGGLRNDGNKSGRGGGKGIFSLSAALEKPGKIWAVASLMIVTTLAVAMLWARRRKQFQQNAKKAENHPGQAK